MHTFRWRNLMHMLLHCLDCAKLLKFHRYCIAKDRENCWHLESHIHVFIYFDDDNKMKNELIIFLVKNKL